MKWIKLFEELEFTATKDKFELLINGKNIKKYSIKVDEDNYIVEFSKMIDNIWLRDYDDELNSRSNPIEVNKKPLAILNAITSITKDFIKNNNPGGIIIEHISMESEKKYKNILNKRANINKRYLSQIPNYELHYYNELVPNGIKTITYMTTKENFLTNPFDLLAKKYFYPGKYRKILT